MTKTTMTHEIAKKLYSLIPLGEVKDYSAEDGGFLYDSTRLSQTLFVLGYPISIQKDYAGEGLGDLVVRENGSEYQSSYRTRYDLCANFLREWADALEDTPYKDRE